MTMALDVDDIRDLRERIENFMPAILKLIANENRGRGMAGDGDFRQFVVWFIVRIATMTRELPHEAGENLEAVATAARRLKAAVNKLRPSERLKLGGEEKIAADLLPLLEAANAKPEKGGNIDGKRRHLAAFAAAELMFEFGSKPLRTTESGDFVTLAGLLHDAAMGKEDSNLRTACMAYLAELKSPSDKKARGGRKKKAPPHALETEFDKMLHSVIVKEHERRKAAADSWRPLKDVIDEVFAAAL